MTHVLPSSLRQTKMILLEIKQEFVEEFDIRVEQLLQYKYGGREKFRQRVVMIVLPQMNDEGKLETIVIKNKYATQNKTHKRN